MHQTCNTNILIRSDTGQKQVFVNENSNLWIAENIKSATRTFHHENTPTKPAEHIAFFISGLKTLYKTPCAFDTNMLKRKINKAI